METRNFACFIVAGFVGMALTASATQAFGGPRDVVVAGKRLDAETSRVVSYRDLNLVVIRDQKTLRHRISYTADDLCGELNGSRDSAMTCAREAVFGTRDQVAAAIERAQLKLAGKPFGPEIAISMVIGSQ